MVPLRRIAKFQRPNGASIQADNSHQNRAKNKRILRVQIVPDLAVAVDGATTVHINIFAAELEEGRRVLIDLSERVGLPVIGIIGELDGAEDFYTGSAAFKACNGHPSRRGEEQSLTQVDVFQERHVQRRSDRVRLTSIKYHLATVIACM